MLTRLGKIACYVLSFFIRGYQLVISPLLPSSCRFYPTCSAYALTALKQHGFKKGFVLSVKRIGRCHPFNPGGFDPVPHSDKIQSEKERNIDE